MNEIFTLPGLEKRNIGLLSDEFQVKRMPCAPVFLHGRQSDAFRPPIVSGYPTKAQ